MTFLTVEDFNTAILTHINEYYLVDTSKIDNGEYENILYDFCRVSHTTQEDMHLFRFEVYNDLWKGKCIAYGFDGEYYYLVTEHMSYENGVITVISPHPVIKLFLYLCSYQPEFHFYNSNDWVPAIPYLAIQKNEIGTTKTIPTIKAEPRQTGNMDITCQLGVNTVLDGYLLIVLQKTDLQYNLNNTILQAGIINNVRLNVDQDYLPGGDLTGDTALDLQVLYGDKTIKVEQITNDNDEVIDYGFQLDLTGKIDNKPVDITLIINETDYVKPLQVNYNLKCSYAPASSFEELQSQLTAGAKVIELFNDIIFTNNINIPREVYIIGNGHFVNLSSYNINIDKYNVKCENINFENGFACFIQEPQSKLVLKDCTFKNAMIADNYKGSVVSANDEGTITELINCTFINCHHTIYVGGELTVNYCKALYNELSDAVDTDYSAFLTSYAGIVDITNSTFDIDYTTEQLCLNETDIKFAQSLIGLSEDVAFNNANGRDLKNNNILPLFNAPYHNLSHIYVKYYYPQIETCVISSPAKGKEDKAVCHTVLGTDWVYKTNVQVTKRDNENEIRKIKWEDI